MWTWETCKLKLLFLKFHLNLLPPSHISIPILPTLVKDITNRLTLIDHVNYVGIDKFLGPIIVTIERNSSVKDIKVLVRTKKVNLSLEETNGTIE